MGITPAGMQSSRVANRALIYAMIPPSSWGQIATLPNARVVKLVDTGDLKSPDLSGRAGSIPASGTMYSRISRIFLKMSAS
jgi:hypothetical protein